MVTSGPLNNLHNFVLSRTFLRAGVVSEMTCAQPLAFTPHSPPSRQHSASLRVPGIQRVFSRTVSAPTSTKLSVICWSLPFFVPDFDMGSEGSICGKYGSSSHQDGDATYPKKCLRSKFALRTVDGSNKVEWLLIRRGKAPSYGQWSLPGGSVDLGETCLQAARRELTEETGILEGMARFVEDPFMCNDSITREEDGTMMFHFLIAQMFAVVHPDAIVHPGDDALDVGWFTRDEIKQQEFGLVTEGVVKVIDRAQKLYSAGLLEPHV